MKLIDLLNNDFTILTTHNKPFKEWHTDIYHLVITILESSDFVHREFFNKDTEIKLSEKYNLTYVENVTGIPIWIKIYKRGYLLNKLLTDKELAYFVLTDDVSLLGNPTNEYK